MISNIFAIRKYITTCYNKSPDSYCWYNLPKLLCNEDLFYIRDQVRRKIDMTPLQKLLKRLPKKYHNRVETLSLILT